MGNKIWEGLMSDVVYDFAEMKKRNLSIEISIDAALSCPSPIFSWLIDSKRFNHAEYDLSSVLSSANELSKLSSSRGEFFE